jgi:D-3-phosphoglycerate dehydrogenase
MNDKFKVVVTDYEYPDLGNEEKILGAIGAKLIPGQCRTEEEVIALAAEADAVLNQYTLMTPRILNALKRCKVIVRYGIGVDNVDVEAATRAGILVCNVTRYCLHEVSEHAIGLLLSCVRKFPEINDTVKRGQWSYRLHRPIDRMHGRTLGIVGLGNIGRMVAKKIQPWGLRLLANDPYIPDDVFPAHGATKASFEQVLQESDFVSAHVPLTSETHYMFSYEPFKKMKETAYFINTSRGKVVDENGLYRALKEKCLAGAALDVMEKEPPDHDHPLFDLPNVIITPHIAWYSERSSIDLQRMAAEEVARVLMGKEPISPVNPGAMDRVIKK